MNVTRRRVTPSPPVSIDDSQPPAKKNKPQPPQTGYPTDDSFTAAPPAPPPPPNSTVNTEHHVLPSGATADFPVRHPTGKRDSDQRTLASLRGDQKRMAEYDAANPARTPDDQARRQISNDIFNREITEFSAAVAKEKKDGQAPPAVRQELAAAQKNLDDLEKQLADLKARLKARYGDRDPDVRDPLVQQEHDLFYSVGMAKGKVLLLQDLVDNGAGDP